MVGFCIYHPRLKAGGMGRGIDAPAFRRGCRTKDRPAKPASLTGEHVCSSIHSKETPFSIWCGLWKDADNFRISWSIKGLCRWSKAVGL